MQSQNRFFDDLAKVAAGAMGTLSGMKSEVESRVRERWRPRLAPSRKIWKDASTSSNRAWLLSPRATSRQVRLPMRRTPTYPKFCSNN